MHTHTQTHTHSLFRCLQINCLPAPTSSWPGSLIHFSSRPHSAATVHMLQARDLPICLNLFPPGNASFALPYMAITFTVDVSLPLAPLCGSHRRRAHLYSSETPSWGGGASNFSLPPAQRAAMCLCQAAEGVLRGRAGVHPALQFLTPAINNKPVAGDVRVGFVQRVGA